ncbi:hypothetical protein GcC1_199050 [Golovinomyces cichoracearum]|uniref:Uncharacterized protein n=1 Tax=Golovinomyces cichoracearum TaxID=62708 RepID=A0A420HFF7_9PEZI|nr:hypothetical protein GcC1_199050 [Golovinomyces cichoracearum]
MPIDQSEPIVQAEIIGVKLLQQQQRIKQAMSLQEILETEQELLQDKPEDPEAIEKIRLVSDQEVLQALELLILAEMQKEEVNTTWIEQCNDEEELTKARMNAKMRQSTLNMYF